MHTTRKTIAIVEMFLVVGLILPVMAGAENNIFGIKEDRQGTWDFYLPLSYAEESTISGQQGFRVDLKMILDSVSVLGTTSTRTSS